MKKKKKNNVSEHPLMLNYQTKQTHYFEEESIFKNMSKTRTLYHCEAEKQTSKTCEWMNDQERTNLA